MQTVDRELFLPCLNSNRLARGQRLHSDALNGTIEVIDGEKDVGKFLSWCGDVVGS